MDGVGPFVYDFKPTSVPVMFGPEYWLNPKEKDKEGVNFVETFIGDPSICRLYLGFSKLDTETAEAMRKNSSVTRLKAYSHVLDFFGGMFEIRDGKAVLPGGARSAAVWTELAGAPPDQGTAFNFHGFRFQVLRKNRNRLTALRITPLSRLKPTAPATAVPAPAAP